MFKYGLNYNIFFYFLVVIIGSDYLIWKCSLFKGDYFFEIGCWGDGVDEWRRIERGFKLLWMKGTKISCRKFVGKGSIEWKYLYDLIFCGLKIWSILYLFREFYLIFIFIKLVKINTLKTFKACFKKSGKFYKNFWKISKKVTKRF